MTGLHGNDEERTERYVGIIVVYLPVSLEVHHDPPFIAYPSTNIVVIVAMFGVLRCEAVVKAAGYGNKYVAS